MPMLRLLSPVLLATAVLAQTSTQAAPAANRFVPADSVLVVRIAAPAAWGPKFDRTQAAKVLRTPHAKQLVEALTHNLDSGLAALRKSGTVDADLVEKLLTAYAGDVTFSVQVDWDDVQTSMMEDRPPHFSMVIALSGDGAYDLAGLANSIQQLVEKESDHRRPLKDLTCGDVRLRITSDESPVEVSVPTMVDGQLVMMFGTDLEGNAARLLRNDKRYDGEIPKHPFFVHAKLDRLMATMLESIESQLDASGQMPFEMGPILRKTGLASLGHVDMSIDAEDKVTTASFRIGFGEGELGFMAAMMGQGQPKLLRYLPAGCEQFSAQHFDLNVFYDTAIGIWKDLGEAVPMTAEDGEAAFAETLKVRLKEDLLAHIGDEMLSFQNTVAPGNEEDEEPMAGPFAAVGGSCFVLSLRDGKAFGKNLETALRSRGMHAARKSEDYADTKIYQLRLGGLIDLEYAVTDEMLLLTLGKSEAGHRNLRGVLDAQKRGGSTTLPDALAKQVAMLPEGWSGLGVTPVDGMIAAMMGGLSGVTAAPGFPEELQEVVSTMRGLAQDLRAAGIGPMIGASYAKGRVFESRVRW